MEAIKAKGKLEAEGTQWRKGDHKFWHKRKAIFAEVERISKDEKVFLNSAAALLEAPEGEKDGGHNIAKIAAETQGRVDAPCSATASACCHRISG